jgi:hypothetical protein
MLDGDRDRGPSADRINQRLSAHFAIFRDTPEALQCSPDNHHKGIVAGVLEHHGPGVAQLALDLSMTRQVALSSSLTVLIAPGRNGVFLLTPDGSGEFRVGFGASVESVLAGQPMGSSGPTYFGLSPDGVTFQHITLCDGSATQTQVVHNAYSFTDPSWRAAALDDE